MKEEFNDCNKNYNHLLKSLCNILKERSNKESSYATFLQTEWVSVGLNEYFPFNITDIYNEDIFLVNPTTIKVNKSGVYHIIYKIPVNIEDKKDHLEQSIGLYINNVLQKNIQRTFGVIDPDYKNCMSIIGDDIIYIPENTLLQLKNNGFSNKSKNINSYNKEDSSASINIVKIG
ncbi:MAG: hypothetical protein E6371_17500 [Terrisporobacter othiniensis]|uniref:hypothetical protein n=1 Tax=Terrisporobacter othiniensis TaxID=1577792 RepID=UPI00290E7399|nr:hypothetical protein [Terrisporobacter othiniensis]MDU6986202.1 hypothetical protein [Terrisporobacter othiniensis]